VGFVSLYQPWRLSCFGSAMEKDVYRVDVLALSLVSSRTLLLVPSTKEVLDAEPIGD